MNAVSERAHPLARVLDITPDQYHSDPCEVPSLSSSIAHTIVSESPLHAWSKHPKLGKAQSAPTSATDDGSVIHRLLLGKGAAISIIAANDFRTKAAQEARDAARAAGSVPVLEWKYAELAATAEHLKAKLAARGIVLNGQSEVAIEWEEDGEHGPVRCRSMLDHVWVDQGRIIDVKKIRSAHPRVCARHAIEYGYDIQKACYSRALSRLRPDLEGRIRYQFLFLELDPPYDIVPADLDGQLSELGDMRWSRAVEIWERCLLTNRWPGYAETPVRLTASAWAISQEMEAISGE